MIEQVDDLKKSDLHRSNQKSVEERKGGGVMLRDYGTEKVEVENNLKEFIENIVRRWNNKH